MSTSKKGLGFIAAPDQNVKHDFAILDRYHAFSAELLRLALLAIPGLGFLLTYLFLHHDDKIYLNVFKDWHVRFCSSAALICFGISVAFSLGHRYFSTESMTCHLASLRYGLRDTPGDEQKCKREATRRNRVFNCSVLALAVSAITLCVGAGLLAVTFTYAIAYIAQNA